MAYRRTYKRYTPRRRYASKKRTYSSRRVVPGYTRTVGFYGRSLRSKGSTVEQKSKTTFHQQIQPISDDGHIISMNPIERGPDYNERIGRKITLTKLQVRFLMTMESVNGYPHNGSDIEQLMRSQQIRVMVLVDTQTNGALPILPEILDWVGSTTPNYAAAFMNLSNSQRFRVLKDKVYTFNRDLAVAPIPSTTVAGVFMNEKSQWFTFNKKVKIPIMFQDTDAGSGATVNVRSNNVYLVFIPVQVYDSPLVAQPNVMLHGTTRVRYIDN